MKKIWLAIAGIVAVLGLVLLTGCAAGNPGSVNVNLNSQNEGMWVSGEGKVQVTPDLAVISLGIEAQALTVAEAQAQAADAMDKVMQALKAQGIDAQDIQTSYYNISQMTRWNDTKQEQEVTGYRVNNTVTAKIHDVKKAGEVIDAVAAAGGDLTRINNISFSVNDPTAAYADARKLAVANAKDKAQQMAKEAGITLGKITYITENNYYQPIYRSFESIDSAKGAVPAVSTPVEAGQLDVTTTVQIAYELK